MTSTTERRFFSSEIRSSARGSKRSISGYAATFNTPFSKYMERALGFTEKINPGAFKRAIQTRQDVICTQDHRSELLMGRVSNGTLRLQEDSKGLHFECDTPDTQAARDLHTLINRGDIKGCSFVFTPNGKNGDLWSQKNGQASRTLLDVDLIDVCACAVPAYDQGTSVGAQQNSLQEIERSLFPNGVPSEIRSHQALIIAHLRSQLSDLPEPTDPKLWNLWAALRVAKANS